MYFDLERIRCWNKFLLTEKMIYFLTGYAKGVCFAVAEFRKLGATIVFASFSRSIIDTGKSDVFAAKAYCDCVHKTMQTSYCNDCRDLDLCRDRALTAQEWRCVVPRCGQTYDHEWWRMLSLRWKDCTYHLQDLVCLKCNLIKAAHLAEHYSVCDASEFLSKMQTFKNVAVDQKFQLLHESVSWILLVKWLWLIFS